MKSLVIFLFVKHLNKPKPKASINKQISSFARLHIFSYTYDET